MSIFDILLFLIIIVLLHLYKAKNPNFLFFCKGAILFLPPVDQKQKPVQKQKQKQNKHKSKPKQKQKQQYQVTIVNIQYPHVKQYNLCTDYDRASIIILAIIIFLLIKVPINQLIDLQQFGLTSKNESSNFLFFVSILSFAYVFKIGLQIFFMSPYSIKICILVSLGINVFFYVLYFALQSLQIYDTKIISYTHDFVRHLEILMGKQITFISHRIVLISILFFNFFLSLIIIPTVIKFGNWYAKTVKQIYYQDEQAMQQRKQQAQEKKVEAQKQLKTTSKKVIKFLNFYLFLTLGVIVLSHRSLHQYLDQKIIDLIRIIMLFVSLGIICKTLKQGIQFNGSFAYQFVTKYYATNNKQQKQAYRVRIASFIKLIWYHIFQLMFRVFIPVLIFSLLIDWKYLGNEVVSYNRSSSNQINNAYGSQQQLLLTKSNYYTECQLITDPLSSIESLYIQKANDLQVQRQEKITINGKILYEEGYSSLQKIQKRINEYGISWQPFVVECLQILFWYFNISLWGLTIVYILFLRKTVYEI